MSLSFQSSLKANALPEKASRWSKEHDQSFRVRFLIRSRNRIGGPNQEGFIYRHVTWLLRIHLVSHLPCNISPQLPATATTLFLQKCSSFTHTRDQNWGASKILWFQTPWISLLARAKHPAYPHTSFLLSLWSSWLKHRQLCTTEAL